MQVQGTLRQVVLGLVALVTGASPSATARAQESVGPPANATFEYALRRDVHSGTGEYAGYTDSLSSVGRYAMLDVAAPRFSAHYEWTFSSSEKNDSGTVDREATFGLADRLYTSEKTDLDDEDPLPTHTLAVWLWIPSDVVVGQTVRVLDHDLVVRARDAMLAPGIPAIELVGTGQGHRNDAYGTFATTWTDRYLFDPTTGMFLGADCDEQDHGTYEGSAAGFSVRETTRVTRASYVTAALPGLPTPSLPDEGTPDYAGSSGDGFCLSFVCGALGLMGFGWMGFVFYRRRYPGKLVVDGVAHRLGWLGPADPLPPIAPEASAWFVPFLPHFVSAARIAGDRVLVAKADAGNVVALAIEHREASIGTILARSTVLCEAMRKLLRVEDFFTEVRHVPPSNLGAQAKAAGVTTAVPKDAYNLYETYEVLRLPAIGEVSYDPKTVERLEMKDVGAAAALATKVWGMPTEKWLRAQLGAGDIGFCVRKDGAIVAMALATQVGDEGRVHTLAVAPEHRGRGLGQELMRARLRTLGDLGVQRVITEIATWNHASLEVARKHGFVRVGEMYVESSRSVRIDRKFVRR